MGYFHFDYEDNKEPLLPTEEENQELISLFENIDEEGSALFEKTKRIATSKSQKEWLDEDLEEDEKINLNEFDKLVRKVRALEELNKRTEACEKLRSLMTMGVWRKGTPTEDGEYIFHLNYWDDYAIANITGYLDNGVCYDFHDNVIDPKNIEAYYQIPPYEEKK